MYRPRRIHSRELIKKNKDLDVEGKIGRGMQNNVGEHQDMPSKLLPWLSKAASEISLCDLPSAVA